MRLKKQPKIAFQNTKQAIYMTETPKDSAAERPNPTRVLLLVIFALAVFERLYLLSTRGFWYDELFTVVSAAEQSIRTLFSDWVLADMHPPLHTLMLHGLFKIVPATELWGRLPSVIIGLAMPIGVLSISKKTFSVQTRYILFALICMSHFGVHFAQEARSYIFVLAFGFALHLKWLQVLFVREQASRGDLLSILALSLALAYLHYFGLFYAIVLFGLGLVAGKFTIIRPLQALILGIAFNVLYAPGYFLLRHSIGIRISDQQEQISPFIAIPSFLNFAFFDDKWLTAVLALIVAAAMVIKPPRWAQFKQKPVVFTAAVLATIVIAFLIGSFVTPTFQHRYMVIWLPSLMILGAALLSATLTRKTLVPALAFIACLQVFHWTKYRKYRKQEWNVATQIALSESQPGDSILVLGDASGKSALEHLKSGDIDGFFNCRMTQFFQYYFDRYAQKPIELVTVENGAQLSQTVARIHRASSQNSLILLAGHHLEVSPASRRHLAKGGFRVAVQQLASTKVYRISPTHVARPR